MLHQEHAESNIRSNHSPAAEQFDAEVRNFELYHGKKLSEFLGIKKDDSGKWTPLDNPLTEAFFRNPIIHHYLARKSDTILFLRNKPSNDCLTQTELEIYRLRPDIFPFRQLADNSYFYLTGPLGESEFFFTPLQKQYNNDSLKILSMLNVYKIREHLNEYEYKKQNNAQHPNKFKFILTPNWKDMHATVMIHVLTPDTGHPLATIFINSGDNQQYNTSMSDRFNMPAPITRYDTSKAGVYYVGETISARKIPFVDASYAIQKNDDYNCTLYGYYFLEAVAKLLHYPHISEQIYELAMSVSQREENADAKLQAFIKENLKRILPDCYTEHGPENAATLKTMHLKKRWDLSSEILTELYPMVATATHIPEPSRAQSFTPIFINQDKYPALRYTGKSKTVRYILEHVISVLENEKIRLLEKYPHQWNTVTVKKFKHVSAWIPKWEPTERATILENLIDEIYEELAAFERNPKANVTDLKLKLESIINIQLQNNTLDKYVGWGKKLALHLLNALAVLTFFITIPVKKLLTETCFFSLTGKSDEACQIALTEISKAPLKL